MAILRLTCWILLICLLVFPCAAQQPPAEIFKQATVQFQQSDWDGAITNFTKTIDAGFSPCDSYAHRAYALAKKGDSNQAIADCSQVIKFNPNYAPGYYWRSRLELMLTNQDAALIDFVTGLRLNPKDQPTDLAQDLAFGCRHLAWANFRAGDLNPALTNINRAIRIVSTNGGFYKIRGWIKLLQGQYGSAIADESLAIKYNPASLLGYEIRAFARFELHEASGASEDCQKALENIAQIAKDGKDVDDELDSLLMKGLQNYIHGDFKTAVVQWSQAQDKNDKIVAAKEYPGLPLAAKAYLQQWLEKARVKLK